MIIPRISVRCASWGLLDHLDRFHYMLTLSEVALQVCVRQDGRTLLYPPNNLATALIQAG
ncbi:hypothetical protein DPMN_099280 [Dreissena polymorpha]|uniref:Uncharacterized protein n=1 Tax=Dreissena polymorpha TaxID=45954 RepID=A0A9D4LDL9_DREPO|nr:hypothetical protein DPMN_081618 [Dreissena polymorpha]KAH3856687.1 hypothetical protein DPMN_099280 [Dreissena polymorpha]